MQAEAIAEACINPRGGPRGKYQNFVTSRALPSVLYNFTMRGHQETQAAQPQRRGSAGKILGSF